MKWGFLKNTQKYILDGLKIEMWRENFYLEENEEMYYTGVENSFLKHEKHKHRRKMIPFSALLRFFMIKYTKWKIRP